MEENNNQVMSDSDIVASIEVYILFGAVATNRIKAKLVWYRGGWISLILSEDIGQYKSGYFIFSRYPNQIQGNIAISSLVIKKLQSEEDSIFVSTKSVNPKYIIDFGRPMETYQYFIFPNYFRYKSENEAKASGLYWWADELKKRGAKLNTYSMANIFIFTIIGLFLFSILAIIGLFLLFLVFS